VQASPEDGDRGVLPSDRIAVPEADATAVGFSLVIPVYNEEAMVPLLAEVVPEFLDSLDADSEVIVVDDGSSDRTFELLDEWAARDSRITVVSLSRNFGHQSAVTAGLSYTRGEVVGIIDGDLQDPPEVLGQMLERIDAGADVVYGVRNCRKEGPILKLAYWTAYRIINSVAERSMPLDSGDFCVMRRVVVDKLLELGEHSLFLRGLRSWVGFNQEAFPYERQARAGGEPKYGLRQLWQLLRNGVYGFTTVPLRVIRWLGALVVAASVTYSVFLLIALVAGAPAPRGFSTLILALCFFGGAQLLASGIIGEYVARIYDDVRGRPRYIVRSIRSYDPESSE